MFKQMLLSIPYAQLDDFFLLYLLCAVHGLRFFNPVHALFAVSLFITPGTFHWYKQGLYSTDRKPCHRPPAVLNEHKGSAPPVKETLLNSSGSNLINSSCSVNGIYLTNRHPVHFPNGRMK